MSDIEQRPSKKARIEGPDTMENAPPKGQEPIETKHFNPTNDPSENGEADHEAAIQLQTENTAGLSKSQLKKLRKKQEWEAGKEFRKVKRREKHKEKQTRKAVEREELQAKIAAGEIEVKPDTAGEPKLRYKRPIQTPVSLILDCDFNELMTDKELISLGAQLTRCYSDNRCTPFRSHLAISSWGGVLQSRFETVLNNNHTGWKGVRFFGDDFEAAAKELDRVMRSKEGGKMAGAFAPAGTNPSGAAKSGSKGQAVQNAATEELMKETEKNETVQTGVSESAATQDSGTAAQLELTEEAHSGTSNNIPSDPTMSSSANNVGTTLSNQSDPPTPSIVYLSSDSPHTLERLSPNTSYIIGGIVDKNRHKGLCYKRACERGIPTAKLPIGEYMTMQSRSVLAINHVVEIMLKWMETGDWGEAFLSVIPKRKEAKLKSKKGKGGGNAKAEGDAEGEGDVEGEEDAERGEESEDEDDIIGGTPMSGQWEAEGEVI